jgi:hypothetical protein
MYIGANGITGLFASRLFTVGSSLNRAVMWRLHWRSLELVAIDKERKQTVEFYSHMCNVKRFCE